ncbi:hypothetical protein BZM27_38835 [Paraburkholderia steynii]|uniref:Uncharacterized protein n=1 Tax=Paraburkholderia steynii TaxID=1245441 RepID=A0A4R0X496_9BURK|nr:hypothetical protein BZM27_38835 [Paraburkholderia steynii]
MPKVKSSERYDFPINIERESEAIERAKWLEDPDAAFQCWITQFLLSDDRGFSVNSITQYKSMLGSFRIYLNNCGPKQNVLTVDSDQIKYFLDNQVGRSRASPITGGLKNRKRRPFHGLFR